jgi:hypothetical protein
VITGAGTSEAAFVDFFPRGPVNQAVRITSAAEFNESFGGLDARSEASYGIMQFFENGGQVAWVVRVLATDDDPQSAAWVQSEGLSALLGAGSPSDGIYALRTTSFNVLCVPCAANLSSSSVKSFYSSAASFCVEQRCFLIVDIAQEVRDPGPTGVQKWVESLDLVEKNAAVYFPRVLISDPLNGGQPRDTAPSGGVAGVFARTDSTRGVWKAPAGTAAALEGVVSLVKNISDAENQVLNSIGINALRNFAAAGNLVWGGRTLEGAENLGSEWKYIPVRRMALFLERSISDGLTWATFEPNGQSLWDQIRLSVNAFLLALFSQGAFQGATAKDAYFVKCDQETTTQDDINRGIVNILVGFAPLKPAEFVILKIEQPAGQFSA